MREGTSTPGAPELSDYCVVDHWDWMRRGGPMPKATPLMAFRKSLLFLDWKMHFTGLRGATWRLLGVDRAIKNPNLCNV